MGILDEIGNRLNSAANTLTAIYDKFGETWRGKDYDPDANLGFSPERQGQDIKKHLASIGFGGKLPSATLMDDYAEAHQNSDQFSKIKLPGEGNFNEKLNADTPAARAVKAAIITSLELSQPTKTAQETFTKEMALVQKLVNDPGRTFFPRSALHEIKADAEKAITAQHDQEKTNLEANFADGAFVDNLKVTFGLNTDAQVAKVKKEMLASLDESHGKELSELQKKMDESINAMHIAEEARFADIGLLGKITRESKAMRNAIDKLARERAQTGEVGIHLKFGPNGCETNFTGISVKDLDVLETAYGIKIKNDNGKFTAELPNHYFNLGFYQSGSHHTKETFLSMAQGVKATGKNSVLFTLNQNDPETCLELGRVAYEASLETGFPKDKITIEIKGEDKKMKKVTVDELFATCPARRQACESKAARYAKDRESLSEEITRLTEADSRKLMKDLRAEEAAKAGRAAEPPEEHAPGIEVGGG